MIISLLFALGKGGIDAYTLRSTVIEAAADAIYGTEYDVSGTFRKDKWKPQGFPKAALVLLVSGLAMLALYIVPYTL